MLIGNVSDIGSLAPYFLIDVSTVYSIEMYFLSIGWSLWVLISDPNESETLWDGD